MAEEDTGQERTESATSKRLEDARREGKVPRSRELDAAAVTVLCCACVLMFGEQMAVALTNLMRHCLQPSVSLHMAQGEFVIAFAHALRDGFVAVLPVMVTGLVAAVLAPMTISGWNFSTQALIPNFGKLNPITGIGRVFSPTGLIELAKSLLKVLVVVSIAVLVLRNQIHAVLTLSYQPTVAAIAEAAHLCGKALLIIASGLLVIAGVDVPLQLWRYHKEMRMTREEIKQEMKESEGSPEVKGKIRRVQQEMARRRMMSEVPKADVVITNPTHFAVALRYDDKKHRAPIVVAKGADDVAAKIRELAKEHRVPIFEAPPLARVLYRSVDLNREIPATLYVAVAQVLTYIFQLRAYKKGQALYPDRPTIEVSE